MSDTPEVVVSEVPQEAVNEAAEAAVKEAPAVAAEVAPAPEQAQQPKAKKVKKPWPVPVRILMGLIAFVLCVAMFVVSVAGVLILNFRAIVSRDGISGIVNQLVGAQTASGPARPALAVGAGLYMEEYSSENNVTGSLVDWAYGLLKEQLGDEMAVTREQVQTFVQESTVKDFVADKVAGLVEDFYSGDNETTITVDEVIQLMEENKQILQEQFGVVINQEAVNVVTTLLEENEIFEPLQEDGLLGYIEKTMTEDQQPTPTPAPDEEGDAAVGGDTVIMDTESTGMSVTQIMDIVRTATSYETVAILGGVFVLLMLLLFASTHFSFPATMADTGVVLLLVGLIFGLPTAACLYAPEMIGAMLGQPAAGIVSLIFGAAAWVNFTVLGVGFALIVGAIVVKVLLVAKAKKA